MTRAELTHISAKASGSAGPLSQSLVKASGEDVFDGLVARKGATNMAGTTGIEIELPSS